MRGWNRFLVVPLVLVASNAHAQWSPFGAAVCRTSTSTGFGALALADGQGGVFVSWADRRGGILAEDMYEQHVQADGTIDPAWPADGRALCVAPGYQGPFAMAPDGSGGTYIGIADTRNAAGTAGAIEYQIYLQRLTASGAPAPGWPLDGIPVSNAGGLRYAGGMAPDGAEGVFLAWEDNVAGDWNVYVQHMSSDGVPVFGWPMGGLAVCSAPGDQRGPCLISDREGGVFVAWTDARNYPVQVYGSQVRFNGTLAAGWGVDGKPLASSLARHELRPSMTPDGSGGLFLSWLDGTPQSIVRVQRFRADGAAADGWPSGGVAVSLPHPTMANTLVSDDSSRVWIAWEEPPDTLLQSDPDLHLALVRNGALDPLWTLGGLLVAGGPEFQDLTALLPDGDRGVYVGWFDESTYPETRSRVTRITEAGATAPGWDSGGTDVSPRASRWKYGPALVRAGGGAIAVWPEYVYGGDNLYARRFGPAPPAVLRLRFVATQADPDKVTSTWMAENWTGPVGLIRSRDGAVWQEVGTQVPDGAGSIQFVDPNVKPGERWQYRIQVTSGADSARSEPVAVDVPLARPAGPTGWILTSFPNPSHDVVRMRVIVPEDHATTLRVFTVDGRKIDVGVRRVENRANESSYDLDFSRAPGGVYFVRYACDGSGGPDETRRVVIMH